MSLLTDKCKILEQKYENDVRKLYRMHARRARLVGLWAAQKMFLFGDKASDYAIQMVVTDHATTGGEGMVRKIKEDFARENIVFNLEEFLLVYEDMLYQAEEQILAEMDMYA